MSIFLINKQELCSYDNDFKKTIIPENSKLEYIDQKTGYHAYYEMFTYILRCKLDDLEVSIRCSKYVGAKECQIDSLNNKTHEHESLVP